MEDEFNRSFTPAANYKRDRPAKGYWVISVRIIDQAKYDAYLSIATDAIDSLGGRVVIRSSSVLAAAGAPKPRLVIVEFPCLQDAKAAFDDVAQQSAMLMYQKIAEYDLAIVEGYDEFG